jgi:hypothetical protein
MKSYTRALLWVWAGSLIPSVTAAQTVSLRPAQDFEQRVLRRVEAFRNPDQRSVEVIAVGLYADGFVTGLEVGSPAWGDAVTACFRNWTVGQKGEWLLQYWERTPELWDKDWKEAAILRSMERLADAATC